MDQWRRDNIVDLLRTAPHADFYKPSQWFELMTDAADEIERLRWQLQNHIALAHRHLDKIEMQRVEIERLAAAGGAR